jgi:hypothetical protein
VRNRKSPRWLALEGSGDPGAALLKNRGTNDRQHPQGGKKGEGAQSCKHLRFSPSWER